MELLITSEPITSPETEGTSFPEESSISEISNIRSESPEEIQNLPENDGAKSFDEDLESEKSVPENAECTETQEAKISLSKDEPETLPIPEEVSNCQGIPKPQIVSDEISEKTPEPSENPDETVFFTPKAEEKFSQSDVFSTPIAPENKQSNSESLSTKAMKEQWETKLAEKPKTAESKPRESLSGIAPLESRLEAAPEKISESQKTPECETTTTGTLKRMTGKWESKFNEKEDFAQKRKERASLSKIGSLKDRKNKFAAEINKSPDKDPPRPQSEIQISLCEKRKAMESALTRSESAKTTRVVSLSGETGAIQRTRSARQQWEKRVEKRRPDSDSEDEVKY